MLKKSKKLIALSLSLVIMAGVFSINIPKAQAFTIPWAKLAWKVASYANSYFWNAAGTLQLGSFWAIISTGTKEFNNSSSNVGASVYHDVTIDKANEKLSIFAETNLLNWLDKISIIVTDNYGNDLINKSVTHEQYAFYTSTYANNFGTWRVRFVENDKKKWNCWVDLTDLDGYASSAYALSSNGSATPQYANIIKSPKKAYFIPDSKHKSESRSLTTNKLSMKDLSYQFYDETNQRYVNSLRNFTVNDKIFFEDIIQKIEYNPETNATYLTFEGLDGEEITWAFANNLTKKYKAGDTLKLKLSVVSEYKQNDITFENLDYIVNSLEANENGGFVEIKDYQ